MNSTINDLLPSSPHHVQRKWSDTFVGLSAGENGRLTKIPRTSARASNISNNGGDDIDKAHLQDNDDDDKDLKVKRKAQNRLSQRLFRERKEQYVKDLELKIKQVQDSNTYATHQLFQENYHLRTIIHQLVSENTSLKGTLPASTNNNNDDLIATLVNQQLGYGSILPPSINQAPQKPIHPSPSMRMQPKAIAAKPPPVPILAQQPQRTATIQPPPNRQLESPPSKHFIKDVKIKFRTKQHEKHQQQQSTHPQEDNSAQKFTFSISTPATLSSDPSNVDLDPIEPISLYHPNYDPLSTPSQRRTSTPAPTTSFLDDGYDIFERVYAQQTAFDDHGLALIDTDDDDKKATDTPKAPVWEKITEHAQNNKFNVDHLVEAARHTTVSARKSKLLVDEWELEAMVNDLNYYL
ncbi:hypothetical protein [Absidia glauca]|uniref:BZIP domain-containing protein n=1 Tax=Absidia glauca TaxID=4829 RepID=A0A163JPS7_ABSGL|nr:hypothetical protein [Absidia glauca]